MGTVRKTKATTTTENTEKPIETTGESEEPVAVVVEAPTEELVEETVAVAPVYVPTKEEVLSEAPELYGVNWSAQDVESFKEKELLWRAKLRRHL